jgi:hypothetical protein
MRHASAADSRPTREITLVATTWFACGVVLYGLTPLPLHDPTLGWSAAFWLLAAPLLLLAARFACAPSRHLAPAGCGKPSHGRRVRNWTSGPRPVRQARRIQPRCAA